MDNLLYQKELARCTHCGACKSLCPTYRSSCNETMGARGRILMLRGLSKNDLTPNSSLADNILSCILCEACKDLCPVGINIPDMIYQGKKILGNSCKRGLVLRRAARHAMSRLDATFSLMKMMRRIVFGPLRRAGLLPYIPPIASVPFRKIVPLYNNTRRKGRVAVFAGCSVNYLYPHLGQALVNILISRGYETVVLKGEVCCGALMRSIGIEEEAIMLAKKNMDLFKRLRVEATLCLCPTCTLMLKQHYRTMTGDVIPNIMDINEFFTEHRIAVGLKLPKNTITYHDPCHLRFGLGVQNEPRNILKGIDGIKLVEMEHADECCGFGGLFSMMFRGLSRDIGKRKVQSITNTKAETVVTSCPGCMVQIEDIIRSSKRQDLQVKHIVEIVDEAIQDEPAQEPADRL